MKGLPAPLHSTNSTVDTLPQSIPSAFRPSSRILASHATFSLTDIACLSDEALLTLEKAEIISMISSVREALTLKKRKLEVEEDRQPNDLTISVVNTRESSSKYILPLPISIRDWIILDLLLNDMIKKGNMEMGLKVYNLWKTHF